MIQATLPDRILQSTWSDFMVSLELQLELYVLCRWTPKTLFGHAHPDTFDGMGTTLGKKSTDIHSKFWWRYIGLFCSQWLRGFCEY